MNLNDLADLPIESDKEQYTAEMAASRSREFKERQVRSSLTRQYNKKHNITKLKLTEKEVNQAVQAAIRGTEPSVIFATLAKKPEDAAKLAKLRVTSDVCKVACKQNLTIQKFLKQKVLTVTKINRRCTGSLNQVLNDIIDLVENAKRDLRIDALEKEVATAKIERMQLSDRISVLEGKTVQSFDQTVRTMRATGLKWQEIADITGKSMTTCKRVI